VRCKKSKFLVIRMRREHTRFKRIASGIMLTLLLAGMLTLAFSNRNFLTSKVNAQGVVTIYIRSDGSIDPVTAPISTTDNITYVFTDNLDGWSIVVEKDNIIIDGRGHLLQGTEYVSGIVLKERKNVTIRNIQIKNVYTGISLESSNNNSIIGNTIEGKWYGIRLQNSSSNTITGNNIRSRDGDGIWLGFSSKYNIIAGNNVTANWERVGIYLYVSCQYNLIAENDVKTSALGNAKCILLYQSPNDTITKNILGPCGHGIWLSDSSNNLIAENTIKLARNGLVIGRSDYNTVTKNNITNSTVGVYLSFFSEYNMLMENAVTNNTVGIELSYTSNNRISKNKITANQHGGIVLDASARYNLIMENTFTNDGLVIEYVHEKDPYPNIVQNNTVNGKPLVYLENATNYDVSDAGQVILINCDNIRIENLNISKTSVGVLLYGTKNSIISKNLIVDNFHGIRLQNSSTNLIAKNEVIRNKSGVMLIRSNHNTITENTIAANEENGFSFSYSNYNNVSKNVIKNNGYGIQLSYCTNNIIYHNDFIENSNQASATFGDPNIWDNDYPSGGNYWSNYQEKYPEASEFEDSGIWDTPYIIGINNVDRYPLIHPFTISACKLTIIETVGGTTDPVPGTYIYIGGSEVTIRAIPNEGFAFSHWLLNGDIRTENPIKMTIYTNHTLQAVFKDVTPPTTSHDCDGLWHNDDFTITLTATDNETGVAETYYRINNGPVKAVSVDGQPLITIESSNNTLEYWSVDEVGNEELPHKILTGIKLDKTPPASSISVDGTLGNDNWFISDVTVSIISTDKASGVKKCGVQL